MMTTLVFTPDRRLAHRLSPLAAGLAATLTASSALANAGVDTSALVEAVTAENAFVHLEEFQAIADENGGNRAPSTDGYLDSALYVSRLMTDAGYDVDLQIFPFLFTENVTPPELEQIAPEAVAYGAEGEEPDFLAMTYSGSGDVTANATPVDVQIPPGAEANTSTSGCEAEDFAGFPEGDIAVVQRGECTFFLKAFNAQEAGAAGVVIFNEGQEGRTEVVNGTLGEAGITIPTLGTTYALGEALAAGGVQVRLKVDAITETRITSNVIADSREGRSDRTVVIGAHLDSVAEGPGISDNGSGSAGILEIALQLAALAEEGTYPILNRQRFAWWGAEELGLIGSDYYVSNLSDTELDEIMLNLNFDMIASPNYARFTYDGDGSDSEPAGPEGSAFVEWLFRDWFDSQGLASEPSPFSGRSDYGPFIAVGIPAGGLFTGAEGTKTEEQVALYGGEAGAQYDPCYHTPCDDIDNLSLQGFAEMLDAAANAVGVFARNGLPAPPAAKRAARAESGVETDQRSDLLVR